MAIGRSFPEALQKALRSVEKKGTSFTWKESAATKDELLKSATIPTEWRLQQVQQALFKGASVAEVFTATKIDPWFLHQIAAINEIANEIAQATHLDVDLLRKAKSFGFSDSQIGEIRNQPTSAITIDRKSTRLNSSHIPLSRMPSSA